MLSNCDELYFSRLARRTIAASPPPMQPSSADEDFNLRKHTGCCSGAEATQKKTLYSQTFTLACMRAPGRANSPLLPRSPNRLADVERCVNGNVFRFRDVWSQTEADTLHFFPSERQQRRTEGEKEKEKPKDHLH